MPEISRDAALAILRRPEWQDEYGSEQGSPGSSYMGSYCPHCRGMKQKGHREGCLRVEIAKADSSLISEIQRERFEEERALLAGRVDSARERLREAEKALSELEKRR